MTIVEKWWQDYALPLYSALDEMNERPLDDMTIEQRLARLVEKCPWLLTELGPALPIEQGADPAAHEPEWTPLVSSNIDAFRFSVERGEKATLFIRFKPGAEWRYDDVPVETIAGFIGSASHGGYFAAEIKGKYPETKLK